MAKDTEVQSVNEAPFSAESFVENLLKEGSQVPCDDTVDSFKYQKLPPNYNEERFKRGQAFFHKHIFAHFFGKFLGLITILAVPSVLKILMYTKMSSSVVSAYRRYLATVFHMIIWYDKDFRPGSKLWESINAVKGFHNSASNRSCKAGLNRISQKDMAATQFGFMGFAVIRPKQIGIHGATDEELRDFIYVWRIIGYTMGLEDRFNICRESVEETRQICELMLHNGFQPPFQDLNGEFLDMSRYLVEGMWAMNPFLSHSVLLCFIDGLMNHKNANRNQQKTKKYFVELNFRQQCLLKFFFFVMYILQFSIFRTIYNYLQTTALWLMENFPFLAIYSYGLRAAYVRIFPNYVIKNVK